MNKNLEYVIMVFLAGLLVILFLWSGNGRYLIYSDDRGEKYLVNTMNGDTWLLKKDEMLYVVEMVELSKTSTMPGSKVPDPREITKELNKEYIRKERMGLKR